MFVAHPAGAIKSLHRVQGKNSEMELDARARALFSGGLVRAKSGISMMMMSCGAIALIAVLALVLVLGKRVGFNKSIQKPHKVPLVMLGAAIRWFGWSGFNAGAALRVGRHGARRAALLVRGRLRHRPSHSEDDGLPHHQRR